MIDVFIDREIFFTNIQQKNTLHIIYIITITTHTYVLKIQQKKTTKP